MVTESACARDVYKRQHHVMRGQATQSLIRFVFPIITEQQNGKLRDDGVQAFEEFQTLHF